MNASLLESDSVAAQVQALRATVDQLRAEVDQLRRENGDLRQQVRELRCDVGYWKNMHARAVERNTQLESALDEARAEIRQLKAERFGKQSEKRSAVDRSNRLDVPQDPATPKKKRGQQPGRSTPKRRVVWSPGDDAVLDLCHTRSLEDQPARVATLVFQSLCRGR